jgi:GNAT superfamily N-acetyltransferase
MARAAYDEVISLQFGGWNEAVHGARYAEKVATLPFLVAELDGAPVATVSSSVLDDHVRVNELVVLPALQNRGLGAFLLHRVLDQARGICLPVRLRTLRLNRAVRFYQRHGFVVTAQDEAYIDLEWTG